MKEFLAEKQFIIWCINLDQQDSCEVKLNDTGAKLEHAYREPLKCLAQQTELSKSSATRANQLLQLIS